MLKPKILASLCLLIALGSWIGWKIRRNHRIESGFEKVEIGNSQSDVITAMGKPNEVEACGAFFPTDIPTRCKIEYLYKDSFAPVMPQYFIVDFDENGKVLKKIPLSSP